MTKVISTNGQDIIGPSPEFFLSAERGKILPLYWSSPPSSEPPHRVMGCFVFASPRAKAASSRPLHSFILN